MQIIYDSILCFAKSHDEIYTTEKTKELNVSQARKKNGIMIRISCLEYINNKTWSL